MSNKSNLIGQIQIKLNYYQAAQPLWEHIRMTEILMTDNSDEVDVMIQQEKSSELCHKGLTLG